MTATEKSRKISKKKNQTSEESVKLIEGTFDVHEARDILIGLLNHKISFHNIKNLSWSERFGQMNEQSEIRLDELKKDHDKIVSLLDLANERKLHVKVHSNIEIHLIK